MARDGVWLAGIKRMFSDISEEQPFLLAAAISFYTLLSLAPLLLIVVAVAGFIFGEQAVRGELVEQMRSFVGRSGAEVIQTILARSAEGGRGVAVTIIGLAVALVGATTVFIHLQAAFNRIWDVQVRPEQSAVRAFLRRRLAALGVVLLVGLLLVLMMVLSSARGIALRYVPEALGGAGWMWSALDVAFSVLAMALLAAILFKVLPDVVLAWTDLWVGALMTGLLLELGKFGFSLYLSLAGVGSVYGVFGSLVVLLAWIHYSALILLFGARLTRVYTSLRGKRIQPAHYAMRAEEPEA